MKTLTLGSILAVVTLAACADESVVPAVPAREPVPAVLPASVPMDQYFSIEAEIECATLFRCPVTGDRVGLRLLFGTHDRCSANADELAGAVQRARRQRLVAAGTSRYDGAAARRCLEAWRDGLCRERTPDACNQVFAGTVTEGGVCRRPDDCGGDLWCQFNDGMRYNCPGVCARRLAIGERCFGDANGCSQTGAVGTVTCQYDRALSGERFPYRCTDAGVATMEEVSLAQEGEVCTDYRGTARITRRCAPGLDCVQRSTTTGSYGLCSGPQPLGQPCVRYCQGEAACEFDGTRFEQRCLPINVRNREGERCVQGNGGTELCNVLSGLDCVAGQCRRVGTGELDSVCFSARFGVDSCRAGLVCSSVTLTCRPRIADGMPCRSADECESRQCVGDGTGVARCGVDRGCG